MVACRTKRAKTGNHRAGSHRRAKGHYHSLRPALPRKVLRVEFRIDNNSAKFRSKTDELITYLIGNRSPGTLSDWLQKQGLVEGISANSDPIVNGNSGVLAISASLTDKGLANRDQVVAAIFSYLNLLREKGIDKQYFDELANVLDIDFRYPSITRDMDYVEWLADTMIRVPVEHTLDAVNIADRYDAKAVKRTSGDDDATECAYLVYQPERAAQQNGLLCRCAVSGR